MDIFQLVLVIAFAGMVLAIVFEHKTNIHKTAAAAGGAAVLILIEAFFSPRPFHTITEGIHETDREISGIIALLLFSIALAGTIETMRFFDHIEFQLSKAGLDDRVQFSRLMWITFAGSIFLDNVIATILSNKIAKRLFRGANYTRAANALPAVASAGGAAFFTGDITTIMMYLAGKFNEGQIVFWALPPSLIFAWYVISQVKTRLVGDTIGFVEPVEDPKLTWGQWLVIGEVFAAFLLIIPFNQNGYPPYYGLMLGLFIAWATIGILHVRTKQLSHLSESVHDLKTEVALFIFFISLLVGVAVLARNGVLEKMANFMFQDIAGVDIAIPVIGVLGVSSSLIDNVLLTKILIEIAPYTIPAYWAFTAYAQGVGGTLLPVGSVPGVYILSQTPEANVSWYWREFSWIIFRGFLLGAVGWLAWYLFITRVVSLIF